MKEQIEEQLRSWSFCMIQKYSWLRIRFEFSESRGVYLVSFSPVSEIELSDEFNKDAMRFSDQMNEAYGADAPLFTDEEDLFRLGTASISKTRGGGIRQMFCRRT